jgi:PTS system cellobiose-specific IIA component
MEEKIMSLIIHSGEARSYAMEAIAAAKEGNLEGAKELIVKADEELGEAHNTQTSLIQAEAGGEKIEMTLLMVHAQDHFMTSMTLKDLAKEIIEIYAKF